MPDDPGVAVVIITHLNPERESVLHEIVARYTSLTVQIAEDGAIAAANNVYVMRPTPSSRSPGGRLVVTKGGIRRERKPVDLFFSALAMDLGEFAGGVVLSGGDGDGTLGVKSIKERGGITFAQVKDGYGPAHPSMPDSAISAGFVDFALPADEMGPRLVEFARGLGGLERLAGPDGRGPEANRLEQARTEICAILRKQVGHDFAGYKVRTFLRRVQRRMQVVQLDTMEAYIARLRQDPPEAVLLFRDLLINVTSFFRDADAFDTLAEMVIPRLFERRLTDGVIRVWVPGCATGEEVYSIAILVREHMDTVDTDARVQIFATDIDDLALSVARSGRYPGRPARECLASAAGAVLQGRRQQLRAGQGGARAVHLLPAQRHPGPAILPHGSRVMPQPADLLRHGRAGPGDPDLPLRVAAERLPVPRHI